MPQTGQERIFIACYLYPAYFGGPTVPVPAVMLVPGTAALPLPPEWVA